MMISSIKVLFTTLPVLLCALLTGNVAAQDTASRSPQHHGPHVHGEAELQAVLDNDRLLLEFRSPAMNLLGFEHPPRDHRQQAAIEQAGKLLGSPQARFTFLGTACRSIKVQIEQPYANSRHTNDGRDNPQHEHEHEHDIEEHQQHTEFTARYLFLCRQPEKLTRIVTDLFSVFPGIRRIQASWVLPGSQGAATMTPLHSQLKVD
jgi:hypothetical protein